MQNERDGVTKVVRMKKKTPHEGVERVGDSSRHSSSSHRPSLSRRPPRRVVALVASSPLYGRVKNVSEAQTMSGVCCYYNSDT